MFPYHQRVHGTVLEKVILFCYMQRYVSFVLVH